MIRIKVYNNSIKFINYLIYNNICYSNLVKCDKCFIFDINYEDLKYFECFKYDIVKYYGVKNIINFILYNKLVFVGLIFGLFILFLLSNTIFDVKVNVNDNELRNKITYSLKKYDIEKYKKKKGYSELQNIKENILKENNEILEWMEIEENGCNYSVNITPRVKGSLDNQNNVYQNIVASSDGLILYVNVESGMIVKDKNDYVKKGDVIISGSIYKGDKFIGNTMAKGKVYAEVWYTSKVSVPYSYTEYVKKGKTINHYYIDIFGKEMTLIGKYDSDKVFSHKELLIHKPYLLFDLYKETKELYDYVNVKLDKKKAYDLALSRSDEEINRTLNDEEYIISKKVLKKEVFSSKMEVEVFYKVYKDITGTSRIEEVLNDS